VLPRILVADPDPGFGLMLAQMLELNCEYVADYVSSGGQALRLAREKLPQLVIIDAALVDMTPLALIKALRQVSPDVRILVIPLISSLPVEYEELNLQGTLPKPFFADDLGGCIAQALAGVVTPAVSAPASRSTGRVYPRAAPTARQVVDVIPAPTVPAPATPTPASPVLAAPATPMQEPLAPPGISPRVRPAGRDDPVRRPSGSISPRVRSAGQPPRDVQRPPATVAQTGEPRLSAVDAALNTLSKEISAEALFVIKAGSVVAQRSRMNELRQESLADLLADWFKIAAGMAAFVGERGGRFKQLHFEGERFHIYGIAIGDASILVAICRSDVTFGSLRLSIKTASAEIAGHLL
jgi:CheY-like chemotaxis protein